MPEPVGKRAMVNSSWGKATTAQPLVIGTSVRQLQLEWQFSRCRKVRFSEALQAATGPNCDHRQTDRAQPNADSRILQPWQVVAART